jgi:hypothetical protein
MWLAAIDIDPNHGMDDPKSPPRQEFKGIMFRWAELLQGRLAIYDYDQGQLVARFAQPSQHAFAQDAALLEGGHPGVNTESRGATATTFLNLFFRLQLLWNPDADVDTPLLRVLLPALRPAARAHGGVLERDLRGLKDTIATEHEHFVAPAIYTPELVERLGRSLAAAQSAVAPLRSKAASRATKGST